MIIAAAALQAYGSMAEAKAKAEDALENRAIARHNALLAERDRQAALRETDEAQMVHLYESEQAKGAARVRQGASGASTSVGAPFRERAQMSSWLAFESFRIGREGRETAEDFRQEVYAQKRMGKRYGEAAKNAMKQGYLGAGSAILGGGQQAAQQGQFAQPRTSSYSARASQPKATNTKLYRTH